MSPHSIGRITDLHTTRCHTQLVRQLLPHTGVGLCVVDVHRLQYLELRPRRALAMLDFVGLVSDMLSAGQEANR